MWQSMKAANGGGPFGATREEWVRHDPSLHTDCIKAALRIESYGPWVLPNWDIYAQLRRQYKPVEMVLLPGGSHSLSAVGDRMASLQGNVDWYRFWLQGERRGKPLLAAETPQLLDAQYDTWQQMVALKDAADAQPRCPALYK